MLCRRCECERGAAPAVTTRNRDPGRPWIRPPGVRQTPRLVPCSCQEHVGASHCAGQESGAPRSRREPRRRRSGAPLAQPVSTETGPVLDGARVCWRQWRSAPSDEGAKGKPLLLGLRAFARSGNRKAGLSSRGHPQREWRSMPRRSMSPDLIRGWKPVRRPGA
jgi:hypothetical protein